MFKLRELFKLRHVAENASAPLTASDAISDEHGELTKEIEAIVSDFQKLASELLDDPQEKIVSHYANHDTILSYCTHFHDFLISDRPRFAKEIGVDLGCWLGLSTIVLHRMGAGSVHGLDVVDEYIQYCKLFKGILDLENVEYQLIPGEHFGRLPIEDNSVDWVLTNDVFSFAHPSTHTHMISEATRILRTGGTFYLTDANNPNCSSAIQRVRASWKKFEHRRDDADGKIGMFVEQRMEMIANHIPEWQDKKTYTCALETAYCWGEQILDYAAAVELGNPVKASYYDPNGSKPPIDPIHGCGRGTFTDPVELERSFMAAGLEPELLFNLALPDTSTREDDLKCCERFYLKGTKTGT